MSEVRGATIEINAAVPRFLFHEHVVAEELFKSLVDDRIHENRKHAVAGPIDPSERSR